MIEGGPVWWTRQGQPRPLRPLPVLAIDPAQLPRLEEMTTNAENRLAEAHTKAWLGEVAALEESLIHPRRRHDEAIVKLGSAQMAVRSTARTMTMSPMQLPVMPPVKPMLAKSVPEIPTGPLSFEPKWDGFRSIMFRDGDEVEIGSRNEKPMTRYFPEVVEAVRANLPERA